MASKKQEKNKNIVENEEKKELEKSKEDLKNNDIEEKKEENKKEPKIDIKNISENNNKKQKKQIKIAIIIILIFILILFFSVAFSILNINKTTYMSGITIQGIDISGMTVNEAKEKLESKIKNELSKAIDIKYNDETLISIIPEEIEFEYELTKNLKEAYEIGRNGNIFENNYNILFTAILKKEIKLTYTYNENKLDEIINNLSSNIPDLVKNPSYYIEEEELIIVPGTDGVIVEKEKFKNKILENIINGDKKVLDVIVSPKQAEEINVEKIHEEIYCEPKDAYYVEEPFELHMDENGIDFKIGIEEAKKIVSKQAEEYKIPLKITKAKITINDIDSSAFRYEISKFTTNYDPGYKSRVTNLQLATKKINGKVLGPGEEFSFNEVVGKRTIEAGYQDAKIFLNGEVVDGTGGGICQVSTTLYNAVLLANLEITDRRNHNYTTSYVKAGRDATVVYGAIDFKFKNTRKYPIKIEGTVKGGVIAFKIYGIEEEKEYDIKIVPVVTQTIPKKTEYIDDYSLVEGSEVVKQVGSSGCKVTTYKETYFEGKLISKDVISNDTYKAMARIVKKGKKKASVPIVSEPVKENSPVVEEPEVQPETQQPIETIPTVPDIQDTTQ